MILSHPTIKGKKVLKYWDHLQLFQLREAGWIDITPARTEKQIVASNNWAAAGQIARTQANLKLTLTMEWHNLTQEQIRMLNRSEIILQQLAKKKRTMKP